MFIGASLVQETRPGGKRRDTAPKIVTWLVQIFRAARDGSG
jgi:hypothetical protein